MRNLKWFVGLAVVGAASAASAAPPSFDFGVLRDKQLATSANALFGFQTPVAQSSTLSLDAATANASPASLVTLAAGLKARVVSSQVGLGPNIDMMAIWPTASEPQYLIACNEENTGAPALQRIKVSDGSVATIASGLTSCDPVRATAWGTILFGEEAGNSGQMYELADPLGTTGVSIDRVTGLASGGVNPQNIVARPALGRLSFEGQALFSNGVMYYGDENRPSKGTAGGAYYKFIPSTPWDGVTAVTLATSPLSSGQVYGLRVGLNSGNTDYGQGTQTGGGVWVAIPNSNNADLRAAAAALKLTGYYRPEDIDIDRALEAAGMVRFCGNNTGNEGADRSWGETICITDGSLDEATRNVGVPEVQYLVIGTAQFAMMDNIAYQPGRGTWLIHEDGDGAIFGRNNDLYSCLDDGADDDSLSDGCVRAATLNDLTAEWTGGIFDATGKHFFVSVQHNITGHGTILDITGWR